MKKSHLLSGTALALGLAGILRAWAAGETNGGNALTISGAATGAGGAALANSSFEAQVHLVVDGPDGALGEGCPVETQHRAIVNLASGADGAYRLAFTPLEFAPVSHPGCQLTGDPRLEIRALRLSATTPPGSPGGQLRANSRAIGAQVARTDTGWQVALPVRFDEVAPGASQASALPDLQVDASVAAESWSIETRVFADDSCAQQEGCVAGPGARKLLTFDGAVLNSSDVALVIGDPAHRQDAHFDDCHEHRHLGGIMEYTLTRPDGTVVTEGRKQGFCLMDTARVSGADGGQFTCDYQGISPGWEDVYDRSLDCQWVDVTDVPPGDYRLRLHANPDFVFEESDYSNNVVEVPVSIPAGGAP